MMETSNCGNPNCIGKSKLKCTGCSLISYCSSDCQKKHWGVHKIICKQSKVNTVSNLVFNPSNSSLVTTSTSSTDIKFKNQDEIIKKIENIKNDTHKCFVAGDFENSVKNGLYALSFVKELPPIMASQEACQLHLNISTAYMQMKNIVLGLEHTNLSVIEAELNLNLRPGNPQAIEVLSITLGTKAFNLYNADKIDEADESAEKSLVLSEKIYSKNDPRFQKILRIIASIRIKQNKLEEAEKFFLKAYTMLCLAPQAGPQCTEAQTIIDDLCNLFINKKNDLITAEKYARNNYQALTDKQLDERGEIVLSDSASRMSMIMRRQNRLPEAEQYLKQALIIREEKLSRLSPLGIAYTLVQLASIEEAQGNFESEVEERLMKALEIFSRVKGQGCIEVQNTLNQLRVLRSRRNGTGSLNGNINDLNELSYTVTDESKYVIKTLITGDNLNSSSLDNNNLTNIISNQSTSSTSNTNSYNTTNEHMKQNNKSSGLRSPNATVPSTTSISSSSSSITNIKNLNSNNKDLIDDDAELKKLKFRSDDSMARLIKSNEYFEQGRYSCAEILLSEAYNIVLEKNGPNDPNLKAIKGNLNISRQNRLNQLWMQVVTDLILQQEEKKEPTSPVIVVSSEDKSNNYSNSDNIAIHNYKELMNKQNNNKTIEEEMLFKTEKKSSCMVC